MPASPLNAGASQFNPPQFGGPQVHPEFGYLAPTVRFRRKFALLLEGVACGVLVGAVAMFFATMEREEEKAVAMLATPMLTTPVSSAAPSSVATPSSPTPSAPAAIASTPAASRPAAAAAAASTPTVSKPGSSTPASATSTPLQTAADRGFAPVRFVPESIALLAVAPKLAPVLNDTPPDVTVGASVPDVTVGASASASVSAPASASASAPAQADATEPTAAPSVAATPVPAPEVKPVVAKPRKKIVREPQSERTARRIPPEPEPRTAFASPFRRSSEPQAPGFVRPFFGFGF